MHCGTSANDNLHPASQHNFTYISRTFHTNFQTNMRHRVLITKAQPQQKHHLPQNAHGLLTPARLPYSITRYPVDVAPPCIALQHRPPSHAQVILEIRAPPHKTNTQPQTGTHTHTLPSPRCSANNKSSRPTHSPQSPPRSCTPVNAPNSTHQRRPTTPGALPHKHMTNTLETTRTHTLYGHPLVPRARTRHAPPYTTPTLGTASTPFPRHPNRTKQGIRLRKC